MNSAWGDQTAGRVMAAFVCRAGYIFAPGWLEWSGKHQLDGQVFDVPKVIVMKAWTTR